MLHLYLEHSNIKSLLAFKLSATDGEIGKVSDFYFDDKTRTIRYLVVETGNWLSGRTVLISPKLCSATDTGNSLFQVGLSKEQVKSSPDIDSEKPVSLQEEAKLNQHYRLENYWEGSLWPGGIGTSGMMMPGLMPFKEAIEEANNINATAPDGDPHLRSTNKITGYNVEALDGQIGDLEDLVFDVSTWKLDCIIVDTGRWFHGKRVLIGADSIRAIKWSTSEVIIDLTVEQVKDKPSYNPDEPNFESEVLHPDN